MSSGFGSDQPRRVAAPTLRVVGALEMAAADELAPRTLRPHIILSTCFLLPFAALASMWGATLGLGQMNNMVGNLGVEGALSPIFAAGAGCILLLWIIASFRRLREPLADGALVAVGAAEDADVVSAAIREAAARCQSSFQVQDLNLDGFGLIVRDGVEHGLLTVRVAGNNLLVSWSLWRRRSTARLVTHALGDLLQPAGEHPRSSVAASHYLVMREQMQYLVQAGMDSIQDTTPTPSGKT
jgi:hypothetical protein